jgi:hypothetical protein
METTFEFNLNLAIQEAERKIRTNKLFKGGDESEASQDFTNGDPETLYSLASLYAQFVDDDFNNANDAILNALQEKFPDYV